MSIIECMSWCQWNIDGTFVTSAINGPTDSRCSFLQFVSRQVDPDPWPDTENPRAQTATG